MFEIFLAGSLYVEYFCIVSWRFKILYFGYKTLLFNPYGECWYYFSSQLVHELLLNQYFPERKEGLELLVCHLNDITLCIFDSFFNRKQNKFLLWLEFFWYFLFKKLNLILMDADRCVLWVVANIRWILKLYKSRTI